MASTMQNVNLVNPYLTEMADIERRRKLYEALQAQSMQPIEQQPTPSGGFAVPISHTQGFAKIAQALAAAYGQKTAGDQSKALGERYSKDRSDVIAQALKAGEATLERPEITLPEDQFGPTAPAQAAIPADRTRVYEALAKNQNFPDLQTTGLAGLPKPYKLGAGEQMFGADNKPMASVPPRPQADSRPEILRLQESMNNMLPTDPARQQIDARIKFLTTKPEQIEKGNWGEPYQIGGAWVQKNDATGQVRQAVGREPTTHVNVPPPITAVTIQDPTDPNKTIIVDGRSGRRIGSGPKFSESGKMEAKRQFNMQGIGAVIQQADDILNGVERDEGGVTKGASTPTGSLVGRGIDIALGAVGAATPGAVQAQKLRAAGGALVSKMPRMEGPQSDKDVALYKEMAGQIGDATQPLSTRKAALETVKQLWSKYERLNPDAFSERRSPVGQTGGWSVVK